MDVTFTPEQQEVIDTRECNTLVSAAAGSGKTAVLVQRIIGMIQKDMDVDHLLVVTFTKAAAAQMKEKITSAIQKELSKDPENAHLQRQETLIHNAQITTIDSFCQYIIRNNFNAIGLDPSFRVGDEGELKLLKEEVLQELMEAEYEAAKDDSDSDFLFCMDYFATGSKDTKVLEYINQIFNFSMSMPFPRDYLEERKRDYETDGLSFDDLDWVKDCVTNAKRVLREVLERYNRALAISLESDGPYMYEGLLNEEKSSIEAALQYDTYDGLFTGIRGISFGRLSSQKDPSVNQDKRDYIKGLRDGIKGDISDLSEKYFALTSGTILSQMKLCDRAVKEICRLTLAFMDGYELKKKEKHLIDFSDMEHFALEILVEHPDREKCQGLSVDEILKMCTPSAVALEYRELFKEVLVDEYQDSNNVQEMILKAISGENAGLSQRFMVGDVKQSIYRFRLARPEIFMEKLTTYDREKSASDRRIDLHKNFRSREEVLSITNYIFQRIMASDLGGVDYDEDARLVVGAKFDPPLFDVTPELLLLDGSDSLDEDDDLIGGLSNREKEALMVAERITALRQENPGLKYKDIVILLRSLSGWDDVFKDVLEGQGIPTYIESKTGYFQAQEVSILLDMLSVIDNPRQDIPLVAVMHSEIGGFSDEELARIRIAVDASKDSETYGSFYEGILGLQEIEDDLKDKLDAFISMLEELRNMATYTPVYELLKEIVKRTDFDAISAAKPGGAQRRANIDLLLSNAANYEKTSFKGLFRFVRYIEHLKNISVDYGEAGIIDENADVVRIMSIHKSKGLEFPVVFVSGLSKQFNRMDVKGDLIADMDLGIGVKCINTDLRVKYDTLKRQVIADRMERDSLGEEIRVLYVALTRAKEKLIMTAGLKDLSQSLTLAVMGIPLLGAADETLPYSVRRGAGSFFDLVLPSLILHPSMEKVLEKYEISSESFRQNMDRNDVPSLIIKTVGDGDLKENIVKSALEGEIRREELISAIRDVIQNGSSPDVDEELMERLKEKFSAGYSHPGLKGLFTKTSVSELKKKSYQEETEVSVETADYARPEVLADGEADAEKNDGHKVHLRGAERGTAYHRIMELLDDKIYGDVELMKAAAAVNSSGDGQLDPVSKVIYGWGKKKVAESLISDPEQECVWTPDITAFLGTDLGQRMGDAFRRGQLMREKPFMMGVSAKELSDSFPEKEMVLVQGIIDAWFIEGDELVLLDYKTDNVRDEKVLTDRYRVQLKLYKRALEAATMKKVKEVYIYSFALGKVILLEESDN